MKRKIASQGVFVAILLIGSGVQYQCVSTGGKDWDKTNEALIRQHALNVRTLDGLPEPGVKPSLDDGKVNSIDSIAAVELYPGVSATMFWGTGSLACSMKMEPNSSVPEHELPGDGFIFLMEGEVDQVINNDSTVLVSWKREEPDGTHSTTPRTDFVYLLKGDRIMLKAGNSGARILSIFSPLRADYLEKAGVADLPDLEDVGTKLESNVKPRVAYDLYDIQLTKLADGAYSRLVSGKNMQLSFISMAPGSVFPHHIHPEEQMMFVLRGGANEIILDGERAMQPGSVVRIPSNMVHGARIGDVGCDALDIFWPARADYLEKERSTMAAFREIIPEDSKIELLVDGKKTKPELNFTEGPKWLNGKIFLSNMYFDQSWNADPRKSSLVALDPDGSYRNISQGKMQTNGLYPYKNGNLIVCDMMGHRVVEMTTQGQVVRVLADKFDGRPLDGPNDVVTDAKGGFYFTDPQFTMEKVKSQPGRAVYYVSANGTVNRVVEPNEFAMPNGIVLSPDGKTLYINNCYDDESWYPVNSSKENFIWAYDVEENGSLSNGRKFAELFLTENVLERKSKSSSADGMAIDRKGNIYVSTYYGVQIFNNSGDFVGMINLPSFPVSLCFGDADMKTLYMVSYSKVYRIRTNMEGYINYL
jgi:gluconolactonase